ncbi:hypothetical protein ACFFRR_005458 [Megaselia abdita]
MLMASSNENKNVKIDSRPHAFTEFYGKTFKSLHDTGSTASYINENVAKWLKSNEAFPCFTSSRIRLEDGSVKETTECFETTINEEGASLTERGELRDAQENEPQHLLEMEFTKFKGLKGCTNFTEHVIRIKSEQPGMPAI